MLSRTWVGHDDLKMCHTVHSRTLPTTFNLMSKYHVPCQAGHWEGDNIGHKEGP